MAYSRLTTTANGMTDQFVVPFSYLDRSHIHFEVDGVPVADADISWLSAGLVQLADMPDSGALVYCYRDTPITSQTTTWTAPNILDFRNLNKSDLQKLYSMQETRDVAEIAAELSEGIVAAAEQIATDAAQVAADKIDVEEARVAAVAAAEQAQSIADQESGGITVEPAISGWTTVRAAITGIVSALAGKVPTSRTISVSGLLSGGGDLSANRTVTAAGASQVEAEAGASNAVIMTPLRVFQAIAAYLVVNPTQSFKTGDLKFTFSTDEIGVGWMRWQEGTIGDASSSASLLADVSAGPLYKKLWNRYSALGVLSTYVSSPGGSADSDWLAHKPLNLPLGAGRLLGVAGSGTGVTTHAEKSYSGAETGAVSGTFAGSGSGSGSGSAAGDGSPDVMVSGTDASIPIDLPNTVSVSVAVSVSGTIAGSAAVTPASSWQICLVKL